MGHLDPIAYTYDADHHCPDCAIARFGREPGHPWPPETAEDSEGNPIGAVAPWDAWWNLDGECEALACSDCHAGLDRVHLDGASDGHEGCTLDYVSEGGDT